MDTSKTYPRAATVRHDDGWHIKLWHTEDSSELLTTERGEHVLHFQALAPAVTHAAREVDALRARRHPAGQSWRRKSRGAL